LELFLYRKSHGLGLWITRQRLALGLWRTHSHGAVRALQGSGGHCDSSKRERERKGREREKRREREEFVRVLTNGVSWRRSHGDGHTMTLNKGERWCSDGEMVPYVRKMSRGGCGG
jgi:hypothetical protein